MTRSAHAQQCLFTGLLVLGLSQPAAAQNLLANPGFATNLSGWTADNSQPAVASVVWTGLDANVQPGSGSARITNSYSSASLLAAPLTRCVPVAAGESYRLAAKLLIPVGQSRTGDVRGFLYWYTDAGCTTPIVPSVDGIASTTVDGWVTREATLVAPPSALSARVSFGVFKHESGGSLAAHVDDVFFGPAGPLTCTPNATTLCLDNAPDDRRFRVRMHYATTQGGGLAGDGQAIGLDSLEVTHGGLFWFFDATNPELLIKVLDGCTSTHHFWVYYSAGTNVGFTVEILDTHTGQVYTRTNPDLTPATPLQDVNALPCD